MSTVFNGLITSKMRIRILMRLFMNPDQQVYPRELADEFMASPSQVNEELKNLNEAGLLTSSKNGRQINYRANQQHSLFPELQSMVKKALGMDQLLESIIKRLGYLECAFIIDDYAQGKDTGLIDLVLVGQINSKNLADLVAKTERYIKRKIRTLVLTREEYEKNKNLFVSRSHIILWDMADERHKLK